MAGEEISKDELMGFLEALKVDPNMLALMDGIIDPLLESINMMLDLCATLGNCGDIVDDVIDGNIPDLDLSMDDVLDMLSVFGFDSTDLSIDDLASIMTTFDFTSEVTTDDVASFMDAAGIDTTIYSPDVIMETINGFLTDGEIDTESVWVDSLYELMDLTNLNITLDDLKDFLNGKRLDSLNLTFDDLKELLLKAGENLDLDGLVD